MPRRALQLYTLRDVMTDDFVGKLHRVAEMGYEGVEFAGYGGLSPAELARVVKDFGMVPVANHVSFMDLESQLDRSIDEANAVGLQYMVCPSVPQHWRQTMDDFKRLAEWCNQVGERVAKAGMQFAYHNHDHEFIAFDGVTGLDYLYSEADPTLVQAELDLYWAEFAGQSALGYIKRYRGRVPLLHVKDMTADEERFFAEVGAGIMPWREIFAAAEEAGTEWYIVEQDTCRGDPFDCVQTSLSYLQTQANTTTTSE